MTKTLNDKRRRENPKLSAPLSRLLATAMVVFAAPFACAERDERVALVVGNGAYLDAPLANARNDAEDMAALLEGLGFSVDLALDMNRSALGARLTAFARRTRLYIRAVWIDKILL